MVAGRLALDDLTATPGTGGLVPRSVEAIIEPGDRKVRPKSGSMKAHGYS